MKLLVTSYDIHLSHCAYTIVVCSVFIIMLRLLYFIKNRIKSIYYHFRRDHESSSFRKLARNKSICRETCDFFSDQFTLLAINSIPLSCCFWKDPRRQKHVHSRQKGMFQEWYLDIFMISLENIFGDCDWVWFL